MPAPLPSAQWRFYWSEPTGLGRNVFCIFEKNVLLESAPCASEIHIFSDGLYRLIINNKICGYGPARFLPSHPEYDSHDITHLLRAGENLIRIESNSRGADCYQAVSGAGATAVLGHIDGRVSLDFPRGWSVRRSRAWDPDCESYSFAQGPVEICDTQVLKTEEGAQNVLVPITHQERFGVPTSRKIPLPSLSMISPANVVRCARLKNDLIRLGFRCEATPGSRQPFFTYIFSPVDQEVDIGVFWGPLALNGKWLRHEACLQLGNRECVRIKLNLGWNYLFGLPEILKAGWVWQMELPIDCGIEVWSRPDASGFSRFCLGPATIDREIPLHPPSCVNDLPDYPASWVPVPAMGRPPSPARELAWDVVDGDIIPSGTTWRPPVTMPAGRDATLVLDMGVEYLGHAFVDIEAPPGTVLDIGHDERLSSQQTPDYYRCNPFVNSADRFTLHGGRQRVETYHERGGRYLQLTVRDAAGEVVIREVGVRSACGDFSSDGSFLCGDTDLDWAWEAGLRTLRTSMADGWIDPWRERGLYLGDVLVQGHATRKITRDWSLDPWCLRLWSRGQFLNGQMPDVVPSSHLVPLCDYTLLWIIALRNHWAASGNLALVRELWPSVTRIFESPVWKTTENGLWEVTPDMKIFIDWGVVPEERKGENGALNAFRFRALQCAAEMAAACGWRKSADSYATQARLVAENFQRALWDAGAGRFASCRIHGGLSTGPSLHANALALAFGMATTEQKKPALSYLLEGLRIGNGFPPGHCEIYFLYYVLEALYQNGLVEDAEHAMRVYYGFMRQRGAWTLWERLKEGAQGRDSLCHGWSSGAIPHLSERILGVRPLVPGDPTRMVVAPEAVTVDSAEGEIPHPYGIIRVKWAKVNGRLQVEVQQPAGVEVEIRPAGRLAQLPVEKRISR